MTRHRMQRRRRIRSARTKASAKSTRRTPVWHTCLGSSTRKASTVLNSAKASACTTTLTSSRYCESARWPPLTRRTSSRPRGAQDRAYGGGRRTSDRVCCSRMDSAVRARWRALLPRTYFPRIGRTLVAMAAEDLIRPMGARLVESLKN
jgi:hypothetical protein